MAVTSTQNMKMETVETISTGLDPGGESDTVTLTHNLHTESTDDEQILDATTTPPATMVWCDRVQLSDGDLTLNLEAIIGAFSNTLDFTGLRVQRLHIKAPATNTSPIQITPGATFGYALFGAYGGSLGWVVLGPSDEIICRYHGTLPTTVGGSVRTIDLHSEDKDALIDLHLVAG